MKYKLNGISTPFGGVSWEKSTTGKDLFTRLFLYLESKRILVNPIEMEKKEWCIESVLEIKSSLVKFTKGILLNEFDLQSLRAMTDSCNSFLNTVKPLNLPGIIFKNGDKWEDLSFDSAMKHFRNTFRNEIEKIENKYQLRFTKDIPEQY